MARARDNSESWATIAVFTIAMGAVIIDHFVDIDPAEPVNENRYLAKMPSILGASSVQAFREDFERYHRDHLGLRDSLIRAHSLTEARLLGKTKLTAGEMSVYVGADGWLYFGYTLRDYMGTARLTPGQLEWWVRTLRRRTDLLNEQNVKYLFYAAPVKVAVYPEHLPPRVQRGASPLALEQIVGRVSSEHPDIGVLDLRPALRGAKGWHELYWHTDHHWNAAGGCVAATGVVSYIRRWFPDEVILAPEEFECVETPDTDARSLSRGLGLSGYYSETNHDLSHPGWARDVIERTRDEQTGDLIYTNDARPDGLRVVCVGDSFTFELLAVYTHQFARLRFTSRWGMDYDNEALGALVEAERADLVLEERTEWGLLEVPEEETRELEPFPNPD